MRSRTETRRGLLATGGAFVWWGMAPLYWRYLLGIPAPELLAHRIAWSAPLLVLLLALGRRFGEARRVLASPRAMATLVATTVLIAVNWLTFIWAINNGHLLDCSLGYYINPLVSVLLGFVFLGERLRPLPRVAVLLAAAGVLVLTVRHGLPWVSLSLAFSFGFYGLLRKQVAVESVPGLGIESLLLSAPALAFLLWSEWSGHAHFGHQALSLDLLLIVGGALTALPLIGFAYGARRIPYSLVGILQYLAPTLQLLAGVLVLGESFSTTQAIGFGCIWLALALYAGDGWRTLRRYNQPAAQRSTASD